VAMALPAAVPRIGTMPVRIEPWSSTLLVPSTSCGDTATATLRGKHTSQLGAEASKGGIMQSAGREARRKQPSGCRSAVLALSSAVWAAGTGILGVLGSAAGTEPRAKPRLDKAE